MILAVLIAPTPSPILSPLPSHVVNYYAVRGAQVSGLDATLVRSVIDNESDDDPKAVSKAGAVGLMQIEPATASDCGIHDRYDALNNAICGSRTLGYLVHDFGLQRGIAAYNWGAGNVQAHPLESTWPAETRTYVANVVSEYDALQHDGTLVAIAPSPIPATPAPPDVNTRLHLDLFGNSEGSCPDRGVQPFMIGAQIADSFVTSNAVRRGDTGVRIFGSSSALGYVTEALFGDWLIHKFSRHASCGVRTGIDALLTGSAINNAASTEFPK
ncbi:MAG: lytic transglycosylase domain-containing protein [Candidatus Tyrphobacter sp.]